MQCTNYIDEVNEWYNVPFYRFTCYCLFGWYIGMHWYLGGSHLTFDTSVGDSKEGPSARKYKEMWVFTIIFGVSTICDRWNRVEYRYCQDGGHHEMVGAYKHSSHIYPISLVCQGKHEMKSYYEMTRPPIFTYESGANN